MSRFNHADFFQKFSWKKNLISHKTLKKHLNKNLLQGHVISPVAIGCVGSCNGVTSLFHRCAGRPSRLPFRLAISSWYSAQFLHRRTFKEAPYKLNFIVSSSDNFSFYKPLCFCWRPTAACIFPSSAHWLTSSPAASLFSASRRQRHRSPPSNPRAAERGLEGPGHRGSAPWRWSPGQGKRWSWSPSTRRQIWSHDLNLCPSPREHQSSTSSCPRPRLLNSGPPEAPEAFYLPRLHCIYPPPSSQWSIPLELQHGYTEETSYKTSYIFVLTDWGEMLSLETKNWPTVTIIGHLNAPRSSRWTMKQTLAAHTAVQQRAAQTQLSCGGIQISFCSYREN